jgi:hypothetical protein
LKKQFASSSPQRYSERDPEPLPFDAARAQEIVGRYETNAQRITIHMDGARLTIEAGIKPEIRAAADTQMPPDYPLADMSLLPGDKDEYIITSGGLKGQRGFFTRDRSGAVMGVDLGGGFTAGRRRPPHKPNMPPRRATSC